MPGNIKSHVAAYMAKMCARGRPIAIPWDMEAKACIFPMGGNEHRVNALHLFPPTQKLRGATVADLD